jgi:predicted TIM-barrel fold metal-dependent hydrolase
MPIVVHVANGNSSLTELYGQDAASGTFHQFILPTVGAFATVAMSDLPHAFPTLRWAFVEANSGWLPWMLNVLRKRFANRGKEFPVDLMHDFRLFVTCENSDDLPFVLQAAGDDCVVIGTDYGHRDPASDLDAIKVFTARTDLSDSIKSKILSSNARTLYGL